MIFLRYEHRFLLGRLGREKILDKSFAGRRDDGVAGVEHWHARAVVLFECDDPRRRIELLADKHDFLVIGGIEVDTSDYGHVLVYGVRQPRRFQPFPTVAELRRIVNDAGGAMVLAHPFRKREKPSTTDFTSGTALRLFEEALDLWVFDLVDGVEVHNGLAGGVEKAFAGAVAGERRLPADQQEKPPGDPDRLHPCSDPDQSQEEGSPRRVDAVPTRMSSSVTRTARGRTAATAASQDGG